MKIKLFVILLFFIIQNFISNQAFSQATKGSPDNAVVEVQIPKPKFEILTTWQYGGFWRWDEKDPRFFKEFLNKITDSLSLGIF
jgi:hypothetical protein